MLEPQQIVVERYQLKEKLGRTAAGRQTWLAIDLHSTPQELVVVKLLAFNPQMQWDELKLFEREAQVLKNLSHPRIPQYRDYFSIDDRVLWFGLVQEYIPGSSFQELLDQGDTFAEAEVQQLAVNILHILTYLHEQDPPVLHRDIKPSNLILGENGYTYLVDFGAVQDQAAITGMTFTVVGTSGYAPLEQFWGRAVPASDLYALGATLVHLLTGIAPVDLPQRNSRMQFSDRVNLRPFFTAWLEKLTEPALEKRFGSADEAMDALESGIVRVAHSPITRKFTKPDRSRIRLIKSASELVICIPSEPWTERLFQQSLGIVLLTAMTRSLSRVIPASDVFLWWLLGMSVFGGYLLLKLNENTYFSINSDRFTITRKFFGISWYKASEPVRAILGVFIQRMGKLSSPVIRTDEHTYEFKRGLTELEALWLAQEIQHWLNG